MSVIKRKYFNGREYVLDEEKMELRLLPEFHKTLLEKRLFGKRGFKKVGGSSLGDFLLTDGFKSQFAAFCNIANLGLPVLDEKYIKAGIAIEPKVIAVLKEATGKEIQTFDPKAYNYDYFAGKDEILGGIPDGYIEADKRIIEIKTTGAKNYEKWKSNEIPLAYHKQAAQYAYLMGVDKYTIVGTFLEEEDYAHPEDFPIKNRKMIARTFSVNINEVEDDISKIKKLYREWTSSGTSPKFSLKLDADLLDWLRCSNEAEWEGLKADWKAKGKYIE